MLKYFIDLLFFPLAGLSLFLWVFLLDQFFKR
jgi:hypothetical protein